MSLKMKKSKKVKFSRFLSFPQNHVERAFFFEFSHTATFFRLLKRPFSNKLNCLWNLNKASKIKPLRTLVDTKSTRFPHKIIYCGKYVEIFILFPHVHNLFTTWRHKIVNLVGRIVKASNFDLSES